MNIRNTKHPFFLLSRKHFKTTCIFLTLFVISLTELSAERGITTPPVSKQEPSQSTSTFIGDTNFALVSDINNPADTTGFGSASEPFAIAKYDVTASEYQQFLEATEPSGAHGLYHPEMNSDPAIACLTRTAAEDDIHYGVIPGRENLPITYVAWPDAIRYCNWFQHGKPTRGKVTPDTTETGAYTISSDDVGNTIYTLQTNALYFLPSRDQWHKAAYYRHDINTYWTYPTHCSIAPGNSLTSGCANEANYRTGDLWNSYCKKTAPYLTDVGIFSDSAGPYGTFDMGGNVNQWTSDFDENDHAIALGGSWKSQYSYYTINDLENRSPGQHRDPLQGYNDIGFRIAGSPDLVPKPTSVDSKRSSLSLVLSHLIENSPEDFLTASEFVLFNVAPEVLEVIAYEQLGIYIFLPIYVSVMGTEIACALYEKKYALAETIATHMLFDVSCIVGMEFFGVDVPALLGSLLDRCGLTSVKLFLERTHDGIHDGLHYLGIEHAHVGTTSSCADGACGGTHITELPVPQETVTTDEGESVPVCTVIKPRLKKIKKQPVLTTSDNT